MTERVKMAGPFPICIKPEDGKWFNGKYFTIPDPHAGGSMGTVRVRDEKGRVKETWIRPTNSSAEGRRASCCGKCGMTPRGDG